MTKSIFLSASYVVSMVLLFTFSLQIICKTMIAREFMINYALINFLVVSRVKGFTIFLFVV